MHFYAAVLDHIAIMFKIFDSLTKRLLFDIYFECQHFCLDIHREHVCPIVSRAFKMYSLHILKNKTFKICKHGQIKLLTWEKYVFFYEFNSAFSGHVQAWLSLC